MDNEQLAVRIRAGENTAENMLELWQQNNSFITKLARKYTWGAEMEDLMQEGYIGLCNAVDHYDSELGYAFLTCAAFYIKNAMRACAIRSQSVKIPEEQSAKLNKYKKFTEDFYKSTGCEPSALQIRAFIHLDEEDVAKLQEIDNMRQIGSLDTPLVSAEDSTLSAIVSSDQNLEDEVIDQIDHAKARKDLLEAIEALPEKQRVVVKMKNIERMKLKDIAEKMGVSVNAIRTYDHQGLARLRRQDYKPWYKYYEQKYLSPVTFCHVGVREFQNTWTSEVEKEAMRRYAKL